MPLKKLPNRRSSRTSRPRTLPKSRLVRILKSLPPCRPDRRARPDGAAGSETMSLL